MEREALRTALVEGDLNALQDMLHADPDYVFSEKFEVYFISISNHLLFV
jgi:hypothetical protein